MKQSKDKQIREIREKRDFYKKYFDDWGYWVIGVFVLLVILLVMVIVFSIQERSLEQELQSCQDKVPVWTLKAECKSDDGVFNINFTTKEKFQYDFWIKYFEAEKCEVIG